MDSQKVLSFNLIKRLRDNEYDVIPSCWACGDDRALYPYHLPDKDVRKLVKECEDANPKWNEIKIETIKKNYDSYDFCLEDAIRKQRGKRLLEESISDERGVGRRKGVSSYKNFLPSLISDESMIVTSVVKKSKTSNEPAEKHKSERFQEAEVSKKVPVRSTASHSKKDSSNKPQNKKLVSSQSLETKLATQKSSKSSSGHSKNYQLNNVRNNEHDSTKSAASGLEEEQADKSNPKHSVPRNQSVDCETLSKKVSEFFENLEKCPLTTKQYHHCAVKEPVTLLSLAQHACRVSYTLQTLKSEVIVLFKEVLSMLKEISSKLDSGSRSNVIEDKEEASESKVTDSLPLTSLDEFKEFESDLRNTQGFFKKVVKELKEDVVKATKVEKQGRAVCKKLITNDIAANFTWDGLSTEKLCFKQTKIIEVIYEVTKYFWNCEFTDTKVIKGRLKETLKTHLSECGSKQKKKNLGITGSIREFHRRLQSRSFHSRNRRSRSTSSHSRNSRSHSMDRRSRSRSSHSRNSRSHSMDRRSQSRSSHSRNNRSHSMDRRSRSRLSHSRNSRSHSRDKRSQSTSSHSLERRSLSRSSHSKNKRSYSRSRRHPSRPSNSRNKRSSRSLQYSSYENKSRSTHISDVSSNSGSVSSQRNLQNTAQEIKNSEISFLSQSNLSRHFHSRLRPHFYKSSQSRRNEHNSGRAYRSVSRKSSCSRSRSRLGSHGRNGDNKLNRSRSRSRVSDQSQSNPSCKSKQSESQSNLRSVTPLQNSLMESLLPQKLQNELQSASQSVVSEPDNVIPNGKLADEVIEKDPAIEAMD